MTFDYRTYRSFFNKFELKYAPANLYVEGDTSLLTEGRRICVVGSRKVSPIGVKRAELISNYLISQGITVVSGLAEGVDTVAHKTAIDGGGRTLAVLGTPLDKCYPKDNKGLLDEIKKKHLAISQFEVGAKVFNSNFPTRNRTMALISDATIIIEASESSGTQHQGWEALRIGRRLFIMENVLEVSWAKEMLKYGAEVLTNKNYQELISDISVRDFSGELLEWV